MSQDVFMWSNDTKDPRWRLRVVESDGLVDIIEETTTSTGETAKTADVVSRIVLTRDDARRFHAMLSEVVEKMSKPAPIPCGHDEDDRAPLSDDTWRCARCGANGVYHRVPMGERARIAKAILTPTERVSTMEDNDAASIEGVIVGDRACVAGVLEGFLDGVDDLRPHVHALAVALRGEP